MNNPNDFEIDSAPYFRAFLQNSLATKSKMNAGQVKSIVGKFDKLLTAMGAENAATIILESFGDEDTQAAVASVSSYIESNLEKLAREHKGIKKNDRLKALIARFNANLEKLGGITVDGVSLSQSELEAVKVKMPFYLNSATYTATASRSNGRAGKLVVEIRY